MSRFSDVMRRQDEANLLTSILRLCAGAGMTREQAADMAQKECSEDRYAMAVASECIAAVFGPMAPGEAVALS